MDEIYLKLKFSESVQWDEWARTRRPSIGALSMLESSGVFEKIARS